MHSQPPVASQHKKTNKVVWTCKDDWPPKRTSTYERPFTREGNYIVTIAVLPSFFLEVPFTLALYLATLDTDFALGLAALDAIGILVGKCTDLVLGLPAPDVDAVGLSAIRHSTKCHNFVS